MFLWAVAQLLIFGPRDLMDESDDFYDRAIKAYLLDKFLLACFGMAMLVILGACTIVWWVYTELSLELGYKHKFGASWQIEFEKYHGTLSHAHTRLAICVSSILAIVVVLSWFCHKTFHRHRRHKHERNMA